MIKWYFYLLVAFRVRRDTAISKKVAPVIHDA